MNIELPSKFSQFFEPARYLVYYGGRGSAKSHSVAMGLLIEALQTPLRVLCVREFQTSIADSVHRLLSDKINETPGFSRYFKIKRDCIEVINGGVFLFEGIAQNVDSIKSMEGIDRAWLEEADRVSQNSLDILIPTIRKPNSKIIITFNPCNENDPVYQMFIAKTPPPNSIIQEVSWRDNRFFPEVLKNEKNHMRATDFEKYLWVWEGKLRTISEAQIFKGKCIIDSFDSEGVESFYHGMDFGFANDPAVVTRSFIKDNNLYIEKAKFGEHIELNDLGTILIDPVLKAKNYKIYADCARPETISYLKNLGYNITGASKWSGSIEDGIGFLKSFNKIVIHPELTKMREEAQYYSYKVDRRTNQVLPEILDAYNHGWDAIRYSLVDMIKKKTTIFDSGVM